MGDSEKTQAELCEEVIEYVNNLPTTPGCVCTAKARERVARLERQCRAANEANEILMDALDNALPDLRPTDPVTRMAIAVLKNARTAAKEARHGY